MKLIKWIIVILIIIFLLYLIYILNFSKNLAPCAYLQRGYKNTETGKCENFSTCGNIPTKYTKDLSCENFGLPN